MKGVKNGEARIIGGPERTNSFVHANCFEVVATNCLRSDFRIHESNPGLLLKAWREILQPGIAQQFWGRNGSTLQKGRDNKKSLSWETQMSGKAH